MKTFLIITFCFSGITSFSQQQIKVEEAKNHIGDSVKICSKIYGAKYFASAKEPITLLDAGAKYPDNFLTLVIHDDARKLFKKPPEEYYKGANVCIYGRIQIFKEKPEIVIYNPAQINEVIIDDKMIKNEPR
ncbi:MAG: hypothetical protein M3Z26_16570 [Bacteroidota bacterium]|nr:hypothetical protein [Bacteroidota bacterium]